MESSSDEYGLYLRLLLVAATITACVAQISSSMELLDELACHPPSSMTLPARANPAHNPACASCAVLSCNK